MKTLLIEKKNHTATVWLNRPQAKNAFNPEMIDELISVLQDISKDPETRVVVVRGTDRQYCSGADIRWMSESGRMTAEENERESKRISDLLQTLQQMPQPTISLAEGGIFGGALGLLAVSDWVLADPNCKFGFPEVHLGIIPAVIWPFILMKIPAQFALQKALTGKVFDAKEALRINLTDPYDGESLEKELEILTEQLIKPSGEAQKEIKRLSLYLQQKPPERVIMETIKILSNLKSSENGQEGLNAFIEKRKPEWK